MIAELAADLLVKLQAIPGLTCGLDLVGDLPDPGGVKIPLPSAWIIPRKFVNTRDGAEKEPLPAAPIIGRVAFVVGLYLSTSNQIATQLPLLQQVAKAIQGTTSPSGQRWYLSEFDRAATNPGVMVYALTFVTNAVI